MAIESACIPLPSEIIMPFAGAVTVASIAAELGHAPLNLWLVGLAGAIGCNLGSVVAYFVGARLGRPFLERTRWVRFFVTPHELERVDGWFERRGAIMVFVARLLPVVRTFIALPAGIARMNQLRFHVYTFVGSLPWCLGARLRRRAKLGENRDGSAPVVPPVRLRDRRRDRHRRRSGSSARASRAFKAHAVVGLVGKKFAPRIVRPKIGAWADPRVRRTSTTISFASLDRAGAGTAPRATIAGWCAATASTVLDALPAQSIDLIFADPPYLLSNGGTTCASGRRVAVDKGRWDASARAGRRITSGTCAGCSACQRVLKPSGTIWVSGTQHVIFSIGFAMQSLGFHLLNTITWFKPNASPNLACRFFTHSTEIVLWASPARRKPLPHTFHYRDMKAENGGKQMRDLWQLPEPDGEQVVWSLPTPAKSEKRAGRHPTQKPLHAARPHRARRLEPGRAGARSVQRLGHHRRRGAGRRAAATSASTSTRATSI